MKVRITILLGLFAANFAMGSSLNPKDLRNAQHMYIRGVEQGNLGLCCDALFRLAELKSCYPEFNMNSTEKSLQKIVKKDTNHLITSYATLTLAYLNDPELRASVKMDPEETSLAFYQKLQQAIYTQSFRSDEE